MFTWLNKLYELSQWEKDGLPWDSVAIIRQEYRNLLEYYKHHYTMTLTSDGWIGEPKPNWRQTCIECGSTYVVDGVRCACCADGL